LPAGGKIPIIAASARGAAPPFRRSVRGQGLTG
jgi:hypothetical protein